MIRRPPRSTQSRSSAASDVYKRQALHAAALGLPAALLVRECPQCGNQVQFLDFTGVLVYDVRRLGATKRADERLLRRIPFRLGAARRARVLLERDDLGHRVRLSAFRLSAFPPSCYWALSLIHISEPTRLG